MNGDAAPGGQKLSNYGGSDLSIYKQLLHTGDVCKKMFAVKLVRASHAPSVVQVHP